MKSGWEAMIDVEKGLDFRESPNIPSIIEVFADSQAGICKAGTTTS